MLGAADHGGGLFALTDPIQLLIVGAVMGFFVNGMLGGYGALISELYPTAARATAQNVLFNIGRAVGGFGPVVVGAIAAAYRSRPRSRCWPRFTCSTSWRCGS